ncbi:MAG TPA: ATP synthase subunit I [Thermoanaerobaculia bacterium]|nr:ATP synthase subunit I [Thermoanaerobaculia bacterium]
MTSDQSPVTSDPEDESVATAALRRIRWIALFAYVVFAISVGFTRGFRAFVALTCTAALAIICFLWLEEIVTGVLQPSAQLHPRRLLLKALSRFVILGVAAWVTVQVAKFDAVGVLLGFSVVVVGILGEAVYATYRSLTG